MSTVDILLPAMGEGIIDATLTRWLVNVGDMVEEDQSIAEIATDKVDSEIPSPAAGKVKELLFKEGDTPKVGQTIALIDVEGDEKGATDSTAVQEVSKNEEDEEEGQPSEINIPEVKPNNEKLPPVSPLVRTIIKQEGISIDELNRVEGTGLSGRITRDDILAYIQKRNKFVGKPQKTTTVNNGSNGDRVEVVHMDRMRKLIAEHMVHSKQTSAHVTSFIEADVTNLMAWRNSEKAKFQEREGQKLTLTPLFIEAAIKAIKEHPLINSSVDGDKIIIKKDINIGLAAALPNGNLIVPVINGADKMNLAGLSAKVNDLAKRSRDNKLQPSEIQGGTFTITNLGMFDTLTGTPIINQPQVAILAIGAISKRVVVLESENGDSIGIRQMVMLSLSYDHRLVDGALGGIFLRSVRDYLQNY